jgi:hypothetical protein
VCGCHIDLPTWASPSAIRRLALNRRQGECQRISSTSAFHPSTLLVRLGHGDDRGSRKPIMKVPVLGKSATFGTSSLDFRHYTPYSGSCGHSWKCTTLQRYVPGFRSFIVSKYNTATYRPDASKDTQPAHDFAVSELHLPSHLRFLNGGTGAS